MQWITLRAAKALAQISTLEENRYNLAYVKETVSWNDLKERKGKESNVQYDEAESHEKLKQFAGARSISSAQYYGQGEATATSAASASSLSSLASGAYNMGMNAASKLKGYLSK